MILLCIAVVSAASLGYFIMHSLPEKASDQNMVELSDVNYLLQKDIDTTRNKTQHMQQSIHELKASMKQLQIERDNLLNKQYDLLYYQKENLKKWADEVKN